MILALPSATRQSDFAPRQSRLKRTWSLLWSITTFCPRMAMIQMKQLGKGKTRRIALRHKRPFLTRAFLQETQLALKQGNRTICHYLTNRATSLTRRQAVCRHAGQQVTRYKQHCQLIRLPRLGVHKVTFRNRPSWNQILSFLCRKGPQTRGPLPIRLSHAPFFAPAHQILVIEWKHGIRYLCFPSRRMLPAGRVSVENGGRRRSDGPAQRTSRGVVESKRGCRPRGHGVNDTHIRG